MSTSRQAYEGEVSARAARPVSDRSTSSERPAAAGKFLFAGGEKLRVRGVTYGTFRPDARGHEFPDPGRVDADFASMAEHGVNAVRTYTVPARWLLDAARRHGLRVLVGLPWEQHVAFLDEPRRARDVERRVREGVRACAGHPAVLGYSVGNEIPASIVRWHGRRRVERFLERLCRAVKAEDPRSLVTYVNYPTTEYLDLPFLDLVCFNVFLESAESLEAYLARLQNLAGERPLVVTELGLDSARHGEMVQARSVEQQVAAAFRAGCAGAFVFSWTDEWHRGGHDVEGWSFGMTAADRRPKPALGAIRRAFEAAPFPEGARRPRISVVVCSYNGAKTIRDCLDALTELDYPDYEVIVVDDGSTDSTAAIAREYGVRVLSGPNRGLSNARNTGLAAATGEIVAYVDDDAYPDADWLGYLADGFARSDHAGIGGPNLPPAGDGPIADCVANAPGGPIHVLLSDQEAEHIPGCNMAFRREALEAIGGFDPQFSTAGDDVDVCWRLQENGGTLGFHPGAVVWHHRRGSIRAYWKQQKGYGRAEALLERKWPEKYNGLGHARWTGRLYGKGLARAVRLKGGRIYHGIWGTAPFQSKHDPEPGLLASLPLTPEWYPIVAIAAGLALLGVSWRPLLLALPLAVLGVAVGAVQAAAAAGRASFPAGGGFPRRALTALLHLIQPFARLAGRLAHGLTPWRRTAWRPFASPLPRELALWREEWRAPEETLAALEREIRAAGVRVRRGGDFDRWDLETAGGPLGSARLSSVTEEHGAGRQLVRFRVRARVSPFAVALVGALAALAGAAALDGASVATAVLGAASGLLSVGVVGACAGAVSALVEPLEALGAGSRR